MNSIGTNEDVSGIGLAVFCLDQDAVDGSDDFLDALVHEDLVLVLHIGVHNLE